MPAPTVESAPPAEVDISYSVRSAPAAWHYRRRRRWPRRFAVVAVLLVVAVVAVAVAQLRRPLPVLTVQPRLPATLAVARGATLPWPTTGSAVVDVHGLGVIGGVRADVPVPIASITKVMTAYRVLVDHPLGAGQDGPMVTMTAADVATEQAGARQGSAELAIQVGERLSERQLLQAALVASADDAAAALARWDAGSVTAFVDRMNAQAHRLGMTATHYADPSGLLPGSVSSARDQVRLAELAMAQPAIAAIVRLPAVTLPIAGTLFNFNNLVTHDGIVGLKTGSSSAAGGCVILVAARPYPGGARLTFAAVFGQRGPSILAAALTAARRLLDAAPRVVTDRVVLGGGTAVAVVTGAQQRTAQLRLAAPLRLLTWPGLLARLRLQLAAGHRHSAAAGQALGMVVVTAAGESVQVPAVLDRSVPAPSYGWRLRRLP